MAASGAGRKQASEDRMDVRLAREHKALIQQAADYSGESLTSFTVSTLVREARKVVQEYELLTLSERDRERFIALLDDPPAPNEALQRAAARHADLVRSE